MSNIIGFGGFEEGDQRADTAVGATQILSISGTHASSIVASPAFAGSRSLEVNPVNGDPTLESYGAQFHWGSNRPRLLIGFSYYLQAAFTGGAAVVFALSAGSGSTRRLVMETANKFQIQDADGDEVGIMASGISTGTWIHCLWLVDKTNQRDMFWTWNGSSWDTEIDVSGHGDYGTDNMDRLVFGTMIGKGLPTGGGPHNYDEWFIDDNPDTDSIGAATTRLCLANGNGTGDAEFVDKDFNDVDDTTPDAGSTYDEADGDGEKQSYDVADATGTEIPLAVLRTGQWGASITNARGKLYLYDGTNRAYGNEHTAVTGYNGGVWAAASDFADIAETLMPDGNVWTNAGFDAIEVGCERVSVGSGNLRLSQIGAMYVIERSGFDLPDDFPSAAPASTRRRLSAAQVRFG